jgi:predicted nuclease of predicted toxin-antitoxin system
MKLLIDNCLSRKIAPALREAGHDVECVGDWPADPGDPEVLRTAHAAGRVLVTGDRGFGQLVVQYRLSSAGIIVVQTLPTEHVAAVLRAIAVHADELQVGAVVIVTSERLRARVPNPDA